MNLVRSCQHIDLGISLLIHEATFDDDEHGLAEAIKKRHSTVLEALGVAKDMRAEACLLTHFSQRYPKTPPGKGVVQKCVGFAIDGMCIPLTPEALALLPELSRVTAQVLMGTFRSS
jgi:ribonuclease Z